MGMNLADGGLVGSIKNGIRDEIGPVAWSLVGFFSFFMLHLRPAAWERCRRGGPVRPEVIFF